MSATPSLFDWNEPPLPVRASDPATSRAAALDLAARVKARKREVLSALEVLGAPSTASAIKVEMVRQGVIREMGTIRSRLSQLRADGLVRNCGVRMTPVSEGGSGREEMLWILSTRVEVVGDDA